MKLLRPLISASLLHAATAQTAEATDAEPQLYAPYSYGGDGDDDYYPPGDAFAPPAPSFSYGDDDSMMKAAAAAAREDAYYLRLAQGMTAAVRDAREEIYKAPESFDDDFFGIDDQYDYGFEWYEDEEDLWTWSKYRDEEAPQIVERVYVERADDDDDRDRVLPCLLAGAAVVMAGGIGVGFVLGLLYASQRRRPVPATLYRVASKEVDAKGLADLALAEVV